ncbi:MAG: hypothetical protein HQL23_08435 [Candidatus Omnitrophica bacterium]|nr:hypothetical protein [Candidatus Omnitrophota bacterium]
MFSYLNRKRKKGQSTLEYVVLIIIIIGALLSIQTYIKRAIQGRLKQASDDIGDQYSPGNTNYAKRVSVTSNTKETQSQGTGTRKQLLQDETTTTSTNSHIINQGQEYWGH